MAYARSRQATIHMKLQQVSKNKYIASNFRSQNSVSNSLRSLARPKELNPATGQPTDLNENQERFLRLDLFGPTNLAVKAN